jgi:hypothetical protein
VNYGRMTAAEHIASAESLLEMTGQGELLGPYRTAKAKAEYQLRRAELHALVAVAINGLPEAVVEERARTRDQPRGRR